MPEEIENRMVTESQWEPVIKPVCQCEMCEGNIYSGNDFYNFNGIVICEDCVRDYVRDTFKQTAE